MNFWPQQDQRAFRDLSEDLSSPIGQSVDRELSTFQQLTGEVRAREAAVQVMSFLIHCEHQFRFPHGFDGQNLAQRLSKEYDPYLSVSFDQLPVNLQFFSRNLCDALELLRAHDLDLFPGVDVSSLTLAHCFQALETLCAHQQKLSSGTEKFRSTGHYLGRPLVAVWEDRTRAPHDVISDLIPGLDLQHATYMAHVGFFGKLIHGLTDGILNPQLSFDQSGEFLLELRDGILPQLDQALAKCVTLKSERVVKEVLQIRQRFLLQFSGAGVEGLSLDDASQIAEADFVALMHEYENLRKWYGDVVEVMHDLHRVVNIAASTVALGSNPASTIELVQRDLMRLHQLTSFSLHALYGSKNVSDQAEEVLHRSAA